MLDVVIPTLKIQSEIEPLVQEIHATAGTDVRIYATCQQVSASKNRNLGLNWVQSDPFVMLDDDITGFPQNWVIDLVATLLRKPDRMVVSPQLMKPDGTFGFMMGAAFKKTSGLSVACGILPTACLVLRKTEIRFDENFIGSGFEDNDYCDQLRLAYPKARFIINHNVQVIHLNECKNQHGEYWKYNKKYYEQKWNKQ